MKRIAMYVRPNRPDLDATKVPSAIDIAWSTGIYEGEGTCRLAGVRRGLMASVVQKDPEILYRLRDWFGGSVRDNGAKIDCHTWDICGDRCRVFLALCYSFLSARRKVQVDKTNALEFMSGMSPAGLSQSDLQGRLVAFYKENGKYLYEGSPESVKRQRGRDYMRQRRAEEKAEKVVAIA
jgi:hypothetical protein